MQRTSWLVTTAVALLSPALACRDRGPLDAMPLDAVKAVVFEGPQARRRELRDSQDIAFVVGHLQDLARYRTGKVNPVYYITIVPTAGPPLRLRLGTDQVGPDVAADAVVDRWRLPDSALYRFVQARLAAE